MASGKDTLMNTVSKIACRALSLVGFSSYGTHLLKNVELVKEFLSNNVSVESFEMFFGGSAAEGTFTEGSDFDKMIVIRDMTVLMTRTNQENVRGHIFSLDTSGSRPGFCRLRLVQQDDTACKLLSAHNVSIREIVQETNDGVYLSSEKFVHFFVSLFSATKLSGESSHYRHGPCATTEYQDVHGYTMGKLGMEIEIDLVHALQCDQWPIETKEWFTRERLHNWPPEDVVERISHQKCHVVPIGDARSKLFSLEWRISFLLGERELVWNFNNTQVQCYVLLKRILKKYIEPLAPNQLSSYHMKTIIFWLSEEKGLSVWNDENLLQCVADSLSMLKRSVVEGEMQHYFHRQRNLLSYKLEDVSDKERVLFKIDEIQEDIVIHILRCMDALEVLSQGWMDSNGNLTHFIEAMKNVSDLYEDYTRTQEFNDLIKMYRTMFTIFVTVSTAELHPHQVLFHQLREFEENPPEDVMPLFRDMTKIFLDVRVGIAYLGHAMNCKNELCLKFIQTDFLTVDKAVALISHAEHIDSMSGVLYLASLYFYQGKFSASNAKVMSLLKQNKILIYPGNSSRHTSIHLTMEGKARQESNVYVCGKKGGNFPAYDVAFSFDDLHFVPYPVKFECALAQGKHERFFVIHPCVYAYFLLCIGQYCLGGGAPFQDFLSQLEDTVRETIGGLQRFRALNLLGFCYELDGNLKEAFRYFGESLQETRDFPDVLNAAVYHIGILIGNLLEAKENENIMYKRKLH